MRAASQLKIQVFFPHKCVLVNCSEVELRCKKHCNLSEYTRPWTLNFGTSWRRRSCMSTNWTILRNRFGLSTRLVGTSCAQPFSWAMSPFRSSKSKLCDVQNCGTTSSLTHIFTFHISLLLTHFFIFLFLHISSQISSHLYTHTSSPHTHTIHFCMYVCAYFPHSLNIFNCVAPGLISNANTIEEFNELKNKKEEILSSGATSVRCPKVSTDSPDPSRFLLPSKLATGFPIPRYCQPSG